MALLLCLGVGTLFWSLNAPAFVAEDSHFYTTTARRFALEGVQSFSGVYPTNGVHPLWFYLLSLYCAFLGLVHRAWLWHPAFAVPLSLALTALGAWNFRKVERRLTLAAGVLVLPPLVFVLGLGVLYSEAHVVYCALSFWCLLASGGAWLSSPRRAAATGLVHAAVFLARLDSVFLVLASGAWILWHERHAWRNALVAAAAFALPVVPYLGVNVVYFGGLLPVSGWLKSTFPTPTPEGFVLPSAPLTWRFCKYNIAFGLVPIAIGIAGASMRALRSDRRLSAVGLPLLAGALGHMAYTMFFATWCAWYWYFVLPMVTGSFFAAAIASRLALRPRLEWAAAGALPLVLCALLFGGKVGDRRSPITRLMHDYVEKHALGDHTLLVSELPGIVAFNTHGRVLAADLLTANRRLYSELEASGNALLKLLEVARASGHPVEYIVWVGGDFLKYDRARQELVYMDPKVISRDREIGRLHVGAPEYEEPANDFAVWRLAP